MSGQVTQFVRFMVFFGCGIGLLLVGMFMNHLADASPNQPFGTAGTEVSYAMLTSEGWDTVVSLDSTSLRARPGSDDAVPTIRASGPDANERVLYRRAFADVLSSDRSLIAQASTGQLSASAAPLVTPIETYTYRETFESTDPQAVLSGVVDVGTKGAWTATLTGTSYQLVNQSDPNAAQYYYVLSVPDQPPGPISQGTASVVVMVEGEGDHAGAGLLFALEPETRDYYAFVATTDGYAFYRRDEDGFERMISARSSLVNRGASNRLAITATGPELQLFVNDQSIARINRADPADGGIGIIALGTGTYTFEEFTYIAPDPNDYVGPDDGSAPPRVGAVDPADSEGIQRRDGRSEKQETPIEWHVAIAGDVTGPFNAADIPGRSLPGDTLVWRPGMPSWTALDQIPELLASPPPPPPAAAEIGGPPPLPVAPTTPTVPEEPADTTEYYVAPSGVQSGPLSRKAVTEQLRAGVIDGTTLVWFTDLDQWTPLARTRLAELLTDTSVMPAPSPVSLDASTHMRGTWQGQVQEQIEGVPGFVAIDFTYEFDEGGPLRGNGRTALDLRAQGVAEPVRLEISMHGRWRADSMGERHIRLSVSGTTRVSAPELDILETESFDDVSILEIVDQHSLRDEDGNVFRRIGR